MLLRLPEGERVLFQSTVEAKSLRRRASKLIPLPVPTSKAKTRELILTTRRLLCLKHPKDSSGVSIKSELALRASEKLKEKDKERESRAIVASVERKSEKEFVVLTVGSNVKLVDGYALIRFPPTFSHQTHLVMQQPVQIWRRHG